MGKTHKPRAGSLQFWPRKRAKKVIPSVNWTIIEKQIKEKKDSGLLGGICYKVGMARYFAKNMTPDSLTKGKQIIIPITFIECPPMKIASIRFYKNSKVAFEILLNITEKDSKFLKRKMKLSKEKDVKKNIEKLAELEPKLNEFSDIRIIAYSLVRMTGLKKTPDLAEIGLAGSVPDKFKFVKEHINKELIFSDIFEANNLVDIRGLTKGRGLSGPVKRFGISLKSHKSEKGRRRPGSIAPWTPSRVTFRAPMAGQLGFFTRVIYNMIIVSIGKGSDIESEFNAYGKIKTNYATVKGSIQGPAKRPLLFTLSFRPTKKTAKQNYEIIKLLK